jgi:hypothetical protein
MSRYNDEDTMGDFITEKLPEILGLAVTCMGMYMAWSFFTSPLGSRFGDAAGAAMEGVVNLLENPIMVFIGFGAYAFVSFLGSAALVYLRAGGPATGTAQATARAMAFVTPETTALARTSHALELELRSLDDGPAGRARATQVEVELEATQRATRLDRVEKNVRALEANGIPDPPMGEIIGEIRTETLAGGGSPAQAAAVIGQIEDDAARAGIMDTEAVSARAVVERIQVQEATTNAIFGGNQTPEQKAARRARTAEKRRLNEQRREQREERQRAEAEAQRQRAAELSADQLRQTDAGRGGAVRGGAVGGPGSFRTGSVRFG